MLVIDYLKSGGPVMVPLLLASVVAVATFFERMWSLRRERLVPKGLSAEITELIRQNRWGDALTACRKRDVPVARLAELAVQYRHEPRERIKERIEEVGRREVAEMERGIPVLGTIASIGTLLGLLGTVGGMILTFQVIGTGKGDADVSQMAGGIAQALVTTFGGLCVAIPSTVAYRYLLARVDGLTVELEELGIRFLDQVLETFAKTPGSQ